MDADCSRIRWRAPPTVVETRDSGNAVLLFVAIADATASVQRRPKPANNDSRDAERHLSHYVDRSFGNYFTHNPGHCRGEIALFFKFLREG